MATVNKFEDLAVWQLARNYADKIHKLTLQNDFSKEYKFKDQIKDSSGSVMDNIAEGFGRESRLEFINFLGIAKGSLYESQSQLYRAFDYGLISKEALDLHYQEAEIIAAKIAAFMIYLNKSIIRGKKFKDRE